MAATFQVRAMSNVVNHMKAIQGDRGTITMMSRLILQAVEKKEQTVSVSNPAILGCMEKYIRQAS